MPLYPLIFTVFHHYIPQQKPNIAVEISKRETPGMFVGVKQEPIHSTYNIYTIINPTVSGVVFTNLAN
jgi:hypothetical protein